MTSSATSLEGRLLARALDLGATLAGIARAEAVLGSPSHQLRIAPFSGVGSAEWGASATWADGSDGPAAAEESLGPAPEDVETDAAAPVGDLVFAGGAVVVLALTHAKGEPSLDWWGVPGGTEGNRRLMDITQSLSEWLAAEAGITAHDLPYYPDKGGAFLKDSAVLAGLGCIGKNNLLVTPEHGPRVRLRGLAVDSPLAPTGPLWPDPCDGCAEPCRRACPQGAFDEVVYSPVSLGTITLPGRSGCFNRDSCNRQMLADQEAEKDGLVRFCRGCELACIAGR